MSTDGRRARDLAAAHAIADGATARLARLQSITAALSSTVTQDAVAETVLREAMVALECGAGAVVVVSGDEGESLSLLRESGSMDDLLHSFSRLPMTGSPGPYADAIDSGHAVYLESFDEMAARYPAFAGMAEGDSRGAWIFVPLEIGGFAVGALAFGFGGPRRFSTGDRHFADTVSKYCAQALDRVRLRIAAASALAEARDARLMAEKANSAKTVFLRAMSHELRTPLNAITGYTDLLETGIRGPINAEQAVDLGRIKRASAYLLRLINDVLTMARLESARALQLLPISINGMLSEVEELCRLQANANALTLSVTLCVRDVFVAADNERLQQILLNLITNAIKFTRSGGHIGVSCHLVGEMMHLAVTDTGVGVRPADMERVFEPFIQIDRHLTQAALQGVGLGLSISRELARAMRGDLTLESTEGSGSTFTLMLPIASKATLTPTLGAPAFSGDDALFSSEVAS